MWNISDDNLYIFYPIGPTGCSGQMLGDYARELFIVINHVVISTSICLFGIAGNCFNIAVFFRQGLRMSVNLSLCAMSFSDLVGLFFQVWHNFCLNPYLELADFPVEFMEIQYLTAGIPNVMMVRITSWITILHPLHLPHQHCVDPASTPPLHQLELLPRAATLTKLGLSFWSNKLQIEGVINKSSSSLAIIAFVLVIFFTIVLVVNLKRKSKWRRGATFDRDQSEALSSRESKTVGMVIVVATVLIVCYAPGVTCSITTSFIPDFGITGRQSNVFHAVWSFCFIFHSINSSINALLYYRMSSKYRSTLREIFPICIKGDKGETNLSLQQYKK
ncbi:hypothetical protein Btru_072363 [Bulinus truncatus]|nr:hypothetical protein Btru_072363 [Bulinus truncatus]